MQSQTEKQRQRGEQQNLTEGYRKQDDGGISVWHKNLQENTQRKEERHKVNN